MKTQKNEILISLKEKLLPPGYYKTCPDCGHLTAFNHPYVVYCIYCEFEVEVECDCEACCSDREKHGNGKWDWTDLTWEIWMDRIEDFFTSNLSMYDTKGNFTFYDNDEECKTDPEGKENDVVTRVVAFLTRINYIKHDLFGGRKKV